MDYLLDTNFLVGLWRQPKSGIERRFLDANPDAGMLLPWVVRAEFLCGAVLAAHDLDRVAAFLANYPVIWPDEAMLSVYAMTFATLRRSRLQVGANDLWIAAAAIAHQLPLLTRNVRELSRVAELKVIDYAAA